MKSSGTTTLTVRYTLCILRRVERHVPDIHHDDIQDQHPSPLTDDIYPAETCDLLGVSGPPHSGHLPL
jgi:hypothetical protein